MVATTCNYQLNWPSTSTDLQIDAPGHHQCGQEHVRHGQWHNEVIGGGLQRFLSGHGHTHQHVTEHHAKNQQHQQHSVEVIWRWGGRWSHGAVWMWEKRGQGWRDGGKRHGGKSWRWILGWGSDGEVVFSYVEKRHYAAPLGTWEDMKDVKTIQGIVQPKITIVSLFIH